MKKVFAFVMIAFCGCKSFGQITTTHIAQPKTEEKIVKTDYDSSFNYIYISQFDNSHFEKMRLLKGQTLYVHKSELAEKNGFFGFVLKPDPKAKAYGHTIKGAFNESRTKYEDLVGRYFIVKDVIENKNEMYLELVAKDNPNDVLYFSKKVAGMSNGWPFFIEGYFVKTRQKFLHKQYLSTISRFGFCHFDMNDIHTGEKLEYKYGDVWEWIDITSDDKGFELYLFSNHKGNVIAMSPGPFIKGLENREGGNLDVGGYQFVEKLFCDSLVSIYGEEPTRLTLTSQIYKGMPYSLLKIAYGPPERVHTMSNEEYQFVYSCGIHVFVKNGVVTSWYQ